MAHPIKELLLKGLYLVLNNQTTEAITVNPAVADIAAAQQAIGWNQILKGRFSQLWAITQDQHLGSRATNRFDGTTWMIQVIELILLEWLKMWNLRNEDRHGRDIESKRQAETRQTIRELEQFYTVHKGQVTERLEWLFEVPLEDRREQNI